MWRGKLDSSEIFDNLYKEILLATPCTQLSFSLRCCLERCELQQRQDICSRTRNGLTPLFLSCKKGNVEISKYLLANCKVDVEQKGLYEVQEDKSVHTVTPLWCAAVAGKLKVVEVLLQHGANVNSVSDTGSTPVRSACFMTHTDIVKLLVGYGADIQKSNYNGGTCLINSVQSVELCEFLLRSGANVNAQDIQNKTALHYAIQEHRLDTAKLLLGYGADPYLESRYKDDALQIACLKGAGEIFHYLVDTIPYPAERVASAFELIGSTFLDEHHDSQKALFYWQAACNLRKVANLPKLVNPDPDITKMFGKEFESREELDAIAFDLDILRTQSLLVCDRILGSHHKDMIYRLMFRGAAYADSLQYQQCINIWKYALELRVMKDTVLYCDTSFTAHAIVKLFLDLSDKTTHGHLAAQIRIDDVSNIIDILVKDLPESSSLLKVTPVSRKQQDSYDKVLKIITHLFFLATNLEEKESNFSFRKQVYAIVAILDPRTSKGDSLLHLSVMKSNTLKNQKFFDKTCHSIFPCIQVTQLLLDCGAKVQATNVQGNTPLHTASLKSNYKQDIVQLLLDHEGHIDARNIENCRPVDLLKLVPECKINMLQHMSLKCFAAKVVRERGIPFQGEVPKELDNFIKIH